MPPTATPVTVAGGGGFIGGHLTAALVADGRTVRAVDRKPFEQWFQHVPGVDERQLDLASREACEEAVDGVGHVYNLAADMGGMGFIESNRALCMLSVLINTHLLAAARAARVDRYFYASSACVYAADKQASADVVPLVESDAYPAMPEDGYGWEKLFSERMCRHFAEDFGVSTRVARFHNVYGPFGTFAGGREKAPAAICRKVAEALLGHTNEIEIWGDGNQVRSFMYVDDCVAGIRMIADGGPVPPINLGSAELVSINELVDVVEDIADVRLTRHYRLDAPQGVRGRSSDNTLIRDLYGWEPSTSLRDGMECTFAWILDELKNGWTGP
jgi:GDP-D-mannose 3',5'-epimerase